MSWARVKYRNRFKENGNKLKERKSNPPIFWETGRTGDWRVLSRSGDFHGLIIFRSRDGRQKGFGTFPVVFL